MDPKTTYSNNPFINALPVLTLSGLVETVKFGDPLTNRGRLMRVLRQEIPISDGQEEERPGRGDYVWFYDYNETAGIVVVTDAYTNKYEFYTIDLVFVEA